MRLLGSYPQIHLTCKIFNQDESAIDFSTKKKIHLSRMTRTLITNCTQFPIKSSWRRQGCNHSQYWSVPIAQFDSMVINTVTAIECQEGKQGWASFWLRCCQHGVEKRKILPGNQSVPPKRSQPWVAVQQFHENKYHRDWSLPRKLIQSTLFHFSHTAYVRMF